MLVQRGDSKNRTMTLIKEEIAMALTEQSLKVLNCCHSRCKCGRQLILHGTCINLRPLSYLLIRSYVIWNVQDISVEYSILSVLAELFWLRVSLCVWSYLLFIWEQNGAKGNHLFLGRGWVSAGAQYLWDRKVVTCRIASKINKTF